MTRQITQGSRADGDPYTFPKQATAFRIISFCCEYTATAMTGVTPFIQVTYGGVATCFAAISGSIPSAVTALVTFAPALNPAAISEIVQGPTPPFEITPQMEVSVGFIGALGGDSATDGSWRIDDEPFRG